MAECMWIRNPNPVVVEIATPQSHQPSSEEDEIIIINEGYPQQDEIQIHDEVFSVSGMMRVDQDGSIFAAPGTHDQTKDQADLSYKFFQYILNIPSKDRTVAQPKSVLLESQYLQHHFVHWDLPSRSVTCKNTTYTGDGEPPINISSVDDQHFVWVIPTENSNQFALKTYDKPYFLVFTGADSRASLREGDPARNSRFRLERLT